MSVSTSTIRDHCLILNGLRVEVDAVVDHSLAFAPGEHGAKRRVVPVTHGVLHWTAGEGDGPRVHSVLANRGLSIHFTIDREGVIWQYCDPGKVACAHAGRSMNACSWGVEVVDYGMAAKIPLKGGARERYECVIHGKKRIVADYYPAQYLAVFALCDAVHVALGIPREVWCTEPHGLVRWPVLSKFRGLVGHFHISPKKTDPGTRPLEFMAAKWMGRA